MLKKILVAVAALLLVLLVVISLQPATFHVERSATIAAPPEAVRALVDDFHAWRGWSPWEKLDPQMQRSYEGPPSGAGAKYAWQGNQQVGEGRMTIEQSEASRVVIRLEFLKPFRATNTATFSIRRSERGTELTWAMDGQNNFVSKALHLVMDMDKMVGTDFERGLSALKANAEASSRSPSVAAAP